MHTNKQLNDGDICIQQLKKMNNKIQKIVFGYIRKQQKEYFPNNVFIELIYFIVLYYYQKKDEWDINMSSSHIQLHPNDKNTIIHIGGPNHDGLNNNSLFDGDDENTNRDDLLCVAWLTFIIDKENGDDTFHWRFKINSMKEDTDNFMVIGVIPYSHYQQGIHEKDWPSFKISFVCSSFTGYGFAPNINGHGMITNDGDLYVCEPWNEEITKPYYYGVKCKVNDVIEMQLNLNALTLKYIINNCDYGVSHKVKNDRYIAAINLKHKGDSITLL
eukprot:270790_1